MPIGHILQTINIIANALKPQVLIADPAISRDFRPPPNHHPTNFPPQNHHPPNFPPAPFPPPGAFQPPGIQPNFPGAPASLRSGDRLGAPVFNGRSKDNTKQVPLENTVFRNEPGLPLMPEPPRAASSSGKRTNNSRRKGQRPESTTRRNDFPGQSVNDVINLFPPFFALGREDAVNTIFQPRNRNYFTQATTATSDKNILQDQIVVPPQPGPIALESSAFFEAISQNPILNQSPPINDVSLALINFQVHNPTVPQQITTERTNENTLPDLIVIPPRPVPIASDRSAFFDDFSQNPALSQPLPSNDVFIEPPSDFFNSGGEFSAVPAGADFSAPLPPPISEPALLDAPLQKPSIVTPLPELLRRRRDLTVETTTHKGGDRIIVPPEPLALGKLSSIPATFRINSTKAEKEKLNKKNRNEKKSLAAPRPKRSVVVDFFGNLYKSFLTYLFPQYYQTEFTPSTSSLGSRRKAQQAPTPTLPLQNGIGVYYQQFPLVLQYLHPITEVQKQQWKPVADSNTSNYNKPHTWYPVRKEPLRVKPIQLVRTNGTFPFLQTTKGVPLQESNYNRKEKLLQLDDEKEVLVGNSQTTDLSKFSIHSSNEDRLSFQVISPQSKETDAAQSEKEQAIEPDVNATSNSFTDGNGVIDVNNTEEHQTFFTEQAKHSVEMKALESEDEQTSNPVVPVASNSILLARNETDKSAERDDDIQEGKTDEDDLQRGEVKTPFNIQDTLITGTFFVQNLFDLIGRFSTEDIVNELPNDLEAEEQLKGSKNNEETSEAADNELGPLENPIYEFCSHRQISDGNPYLFSWDNHHLRHTTIPWLDAKNFCRRQCMELVSLDSEENNEAVLKKMQKDGVRQAWTSGRLCNYDGCIEEDFGKKWLWTATGTYLNESGWVNGQPDNYMRKIGGSDETCVAVEVGENGVGWSDLNCMKSLPFVCEDSEDLLVSVGLR